MACELNTDAISHMNENLLSNKRIFRLDVDDIFPRLRRGSEYKMIL
jgi:tRNA G37 N-methylase Trm5